MKGLSTVNCNLVQIGINVSKKTAAFIIEGRERRQKILPMRRYPSTKLNAVTSQKTVKTI